MTLHKQRKEQIEVQEEILELADAIGELLGSSSWYPIFERIELREFRC